MGLQEKREREIGRRLGCLPEQGGPSWPDFAPCEVSVVPSGISPAGPAIWQREGFSHLRKVQPHLLLQMSIQQTFSEPLLRVQPCG